MTRTLDLGDGITAIDTQMFDREDVTSAYLLAGEEPTLVETGSANTIPRVREALEELGIGPGDLAHIVVTHIHLDHAGGLGTIAPHYPDATLWVHERGAPHMADPSKLMASAERIYGEQGLRDMFGAVEPSPADRIEAMTDGDEITLGDRKLAVLYTPGHASHHVALLDSGSGGVFVGDALGVYLPDVKILRPATPPPEFDLELAVSSIERIRGSDPSRILFSHFGPVDEVEHISSLAIRRLERWVEVAREAIEAAEDPESLEMLTAALREGTAGELNPADDARREAIADRYEMLSSYEMNAMGIMRYLRKRATEGQPAG